MRILSFDTSTNEIHVALVDHGRAHVERELTADPSGGKTRQECVALLMPAIDEIMKSSGWRKSDLDLLVVGQGPGSFTGIRTGVVTGRTLAQALKLPLVAISNLECYAFAHGAPAGVILSAGRQRFFLAAYDVRPQSESCNGTSIATLASEPAKTSVALDRTSNILDQQAETRSDASFAPDGPAPPKTFASPDRASNRLMERVGTCIGTLIEPICLNEADAISWLGQANTWLGDQASQAELAQYAREMKPLPKVKNIATKQAQIALTRLSLRSTEVNLAGASLSGMPSQAENDRQPTSWRSILLNDFPYQRVQPLYLRSPSVTIKKTSDQ